MKKNHFYRNNISIFFLLFFSYCTGEHNNTHNSFLFHVQTYTKKQYHQCSQLFNHIRKIEMGTIVASAEKYNNIFSMRSQSLHSMMYYFLQKIWAYIIFIKKNKIQATQNTVLPKNIETEVKEQGTGTENREPEERYKIRYINNQSFIKTLHKTEEESEDSSDESSMDYQSYSDNEDSFICSPIPKKETPISLSIILYAPDNHKQQITIAELYNKSMHKMPLIIMKEAKRFNYPKITKKPCLDQFKPITIEHIPQFLGKTQKVEKSLSYLLQ